MGKLDNFDSNSPRRRPPREKIDPGEYLQELERKKPPSLVVTLPRNATLADVDRALKRLKSAMQKCGVTAETRKRRFYQKPSEKRQEEKRRRAKAIAKAKKKEARRDERA